MMVGQAQAAQLAPCLRTRAAVLAALALLTAVALAGNHPARAADPAWADPKVFDAAKKEGSLVVYSSVNEEEGLPIWKRFEEQTGIKVEYVRGSDSQLIGRMAIETRGGKAAWDLVLITAAHKVPPQLLAQIDPPEAQH